MKEISVHKKIDREEINRIVEENDGLACKFARQFCIKEKCVSSCFDYEDCLQYARIGLIRAAEKYKPDKGSFSTYAWYYMQAESSRAYRMLYEPLKITSTALNEIKAGTRQKVNYVDIEDSVIFEDSFKYDEDELSYEDTVLDIDVQHYGEEIVVINDMRKALRKALLTLNSREAYIIVIRYGLNGEEPLSLDEAGEEMGIAKETVRCIESKALRKLRHHSRARMGGGILLEFSSRCSDAFMLDNEPIFNDVGNLNYEQFKFKLFFKEWKEYITDSLKKQGFDEDDIEDELDALINEMNNQLKKGEH